MLQIIGTRKCKETMKVLRFLKERGADFQFVDLKQRALSPGELKNIAERIGPEAMIDDQSKRYRERGLGFMVYDPLEELEADSDLLKTPVVRTKGNAVIGFDPEILKRLIGENDG